MTINMTSRSHEVSIPEAPIELYANHIISAKVFYTVDEKVNIAAYLTAEIGHIFWLIEDHFTFFAN